MRRICLMQCDESFEKYLNVALRTFLMYNKGWEIHLLDLGMKPSSLKAYGRHCRITRVRRDDKSGRFVQARPRIEYMRDNLDEDTLILQLDADTLSLDSLEPWAAQFEKLPHCFSGVSEFPCFLGQQFYIDRPKAITPLLLKYPSLGNTSKADASYNFGVVMLKGLLAKEVCAESCEVLAEYPEALQWAEQSAINAVLYGRNVPVAKAPRAYNFMLNVWQLQMTEDHRAVAITTHEKIHLVHYAGAIKKIHSKPPYDIQDRIWHYWAVEAPTL